MAISTGGQTKSGIQLLMILGVVLMVTAVAPEFGGMMLALAIGMWLLYNILNLMRLM